MNSDEIQRKEGPFEQLFSGTRARTIDFLIKNQSFDYSRPDLVRYSGVSKRSLDKVLPKLTEENLVIKMKRKDSKFNTYRFDPKSEKGKASECYFNLFSPLADDKSKNR